MTIEEALEVLDTIPTIGNQVDALEMAIKALEKDVGKKPVQPYVRNGMGYDYHDYYCPTCDSFLAFEPDGERKKLKDCWNRCDYCGQKIMWGDSE